MKLGKRSLLFGVHQFLLHPIIVYIAWFKLYGCPSWKETICIIIHDWGYWFCSDIDGPEGEYHPEFGAKLAERWLGEEYRDLCLYHSRTYARKAGKEPSLLCWADKLSIIIEPWWLYLPRAWMSRELKEYRIRAAASEKIPSTASHREWYKWIQSYMQHVIEGV